MAERQTENRPMDDDTILTQFSFLGSYEGPAANLNGCRFNPDNSGPLYEVNRNGEVLRLGSSSCRWLTSEEIWILRHSARIEIGDYKTDRVRAEGIKRVIGTITSQAPASWDYEVRGSYGNRLGVAADKGQALRMIVEAWNKARTEAEST